MSPTPSITPMKSIALAQRLGLYTALPPNGSGAFAEGRYDSASLYLTTDGGKAERALLQHDDRIRGVYLVEPGLVAITSVVPIDWLDEPDATSPTIMPSDIPPAPPMKDWSEMSLDEFMGDITLSDQYEVVGDSEDFEPAYEAMEFPDSLPEVWRSEDGRVSVRWLGFDDNRDVCAFMDGKPAGVYVKGMAFVEEEFRRNRIGLAMVVAGSIISNREPALDTDGELAGMIGYSEAGYLVHESAFAILQSPDPILALNEPRPDYMPQEQQPYPASLEEFQRRLENHDASPGSRGSSGPGM